MKTNLLTKFAVLAIGLAASATAFGDVKIKSRQTVSGQTLENTTLIKGKRQRSETMDGAMVSLMQCDLRRDIRLNPAAQTYQITLFDTGTVGNSAVQNPQSKIQNQKGGVVTMLVTNKDTGERKQMFGYQAKHIITTMETSSLPDACSLSKSKMQIDGWYIDADFALECDQSRSYERYRNPTTAGGCQDKYDIKTVGAAKKGYAVLEKMTMFDESGKESFTTVSEVVELSKAILSADLFDVPADYREIKDASELYADFGGNGGTIKMANAQNNRQNYGDATATNSGASSGMSQNIKNLSQTKSNNAAAVGAKKEGTVRIGMPSVKTGAVGENLNAQELAGAIQNTLGEYLKGSKVELVPLEAKLESAMENEAAEKQCDFILYATVSHKKGGGGFGMFGKTLGSVVAQTGIGHTGSTAGNVAGQVATQSIVSATTMSANTKPKDEITLDIKLNSRSAVALTKQFKAKAKSAGEDIISPMMEQTAQAILDAATK